MHTTCEVCDDIASRKDMHTTGEVCDDIASR